MVIQREFNSKVIASLSEEMHRLPFYFVVNSNTLLRFCIRHQPLHFQEHACHSSPPDKGAPSRVCRIQQVIWDKALRPSDCLTLAVHFLGEEKVCNRASSCFPSPYTGEQWTLLGLWFTFYVFAKLNND